MDNQAEDLKLKKDRMRLSQIRKEKSSKRESENASNIESKSLKKKGSQDCM